MVKNYKKETVKYLSTHKFLTLATVNSTGQPYAATLGFVNDGTTVYFVTSKVTKKIKNILKNPKVAYTVDELEDKPWNKVQGIQMLGKATLVNNKKEIAKINRLMAKKFPEIGKIPEDPVWAFVKITAKKCRFLDNTVEFGFSAEVKI